MSERAGIHIDRTIDPRHFSTSNPKDRSQEKMNRDKTHDEQSFLEAGKQSDKAKVQHKVVEHRIVEHRFRSLLKAFSWRITATLTTLLISYWITGSITTASIISIIEFFSKMFLYYLHERIWGSVNLGVDVRRSQTDYQI